jgi:hypothetical protein
MALYLRETKIPSVILGTVSVSERTRPRPRQPRQPKVERPTEQARIHRDYLALKQRYNYAKTYDEVYGGMSGMVWLTLAKRWHRPITEIRRIVGKPVADNDIWCEQCKILARPSDWSHHQHPGVLAQLAGHPDRKVRSGVAWNAGCPPGLLALLAQDPDRGVRQALAGNPICPPEVLQQLIQDPDLVVQAVASRHPGLPRAALAMWQLAH